MSAGSSDPRRRRVVAGIALAIVVAAALGLRVWGIDVGRGLGTPLGFSYHVDEPNTLVRALKMTETLDPNPGWFMYPTLLIYLNFVVLQVASWFGHPDPYVLGRLLTVAMGCATVVLMFVWGRRFSGSGTGLVAAALLAVSFMHVRSSHFVTTDVPMTLFASLAGFLAFRYLLDGKRRDLVIAFAAAGLAAGTKYNGAPAVLMPLVAAFLATGRPPGRRVGHAAVGCFVFLLSFLATTPFLVTDVATFVNWFRFIHDYQLEGQFGFERPGYLSNLGYLTRYLWIKGLGPAAGLLAVVGAAAALRGSRRRAVAPAVIFSAAYVLWLASYRTSFTRNMMPVLPLLSLFAAAALDGGVRWLGGRALPPGTRWTVASATILAVLAWPIYDSVRWNRSIATSTRTLAVTWVVRNLPPGSTIVTEVYGPPLAYTHPGRFRIERKWNLGRDVASPSWFRSIGADFIISNSGAWEMVFSNPGQYPKAERIYRAIAESYPVMKEFRGDPVDPLYSSISPTIRIYDCRGRPGIGRSSATDGAERAGRP